MATVCGGCGQGEADSLMDAQALLARYEEHRRRHDPLHFSEVEVGEFTVTKRHDPKIYYMRFHLFAVVPDDLVDRFHGLLQTHGERMRAEVRAATQRCDLEKFNETSMEWLKSELITSINRLVREPIVRDVAFGQFSLELG